MPTIKEKKCKWYFADQPNGQEVGPNNAMEQSFNGHPYASLIRESIQNSLDAVYDNTKPVRMEFSFRELRTEDYPEFFELQQHVKGCLSYFPTNKNAKARYEPMKSLLTRRISLGSICYIRVSDYNTKGMRYEDGKTDSPFYAFVRSAGVCAKDDESAGGAFGFGKAAYYLMSPISSIVVSTCTTEHKKYFEGISSLCTHTYRGNKKVAVGFYDDNNGCPIEKESDIPEEFRRNEPGTDINIIGFDPDYLDEAREEMTAAVLRNFWFSILSGNLEVSIEDIVITKSNIDSVMDTYFPNDDDDTKKEIFYNPKPYFNAVRFSGTTKQFVCYEKKMPNLGHARLYINKCRTQNDRILYMRLPKMLVYSKKNKTNYGFYGVFYCDSPQGNDYLRNMENPAHNEWKAKNWRVNGRVCSMASYIIKELSDFVNDSLSSLFSLKDKDVIEIKDLEEFLYVPTAGEGSHEQDNLFEDLTGYVAEEGVRYTTNVEKEDTGVNPLSNTPSVGHVMINTKTTAANDIQGKLKSGHKDKTKKKEHKGIPLPGDLSKTNKESDSGNKGVFSEEIYVPYRSFSQYEDGKVYHYIVFHTDDEISNVRMFFSSVGETSDEPLQVDETDCGHITSDYIENVNLVKGSTRLRVHFTDNMKHSVKLIAEKIYEK